MSSSTPPANVDAPAGSPATAAGREPADEARENKGKTYGGVELFGSTKEELRQRAAELGVRGRSTMTK